jgi:polysaccharide export outer membrane protein
VKIVFHTLFACTILLMACNPAKRLNHDFDLFQKGLDSIQPVTLQEAVIQPNDQLSIQVYSATLNQEQAQLFNIPNLGLAASGGGAAAGASQATMGYFVDLKGNVEMPLIGRIKAAGETLQSLEDTVARKLSAYIKNPSVIVKFTQFRVNMMGEINSPGMKTFPYGVVTVLDAINQSGGLKDEGRRDSIILIRQDSGKVKHYIFDLRDASVFRSPAYQLRQNDIVVVKANKNKLRTLNQNPNTLRDIGIISTALSLIVITFSMINLFKNF